VIAIAKLSQCEKSDNDTVAKKDQLIEIILNLDKLTICETWVNEITEGVAFACTLMLT
jgi:hypothetical protein